jgi:phage shock protein E
MSDVSASLPNKLRRLDDNGPAGAISSRMNQPSRFQKLVAEAKQNIREISAAEAEEEREAGDAVLIDVRSARDWEAGHIEGARHLDRGEIELEIEEQIPDFDQRIITYCGGGSRSALTAESLQKMGYRNVVSLRGGFRDWQAAGLPTSQG